MYYLPQLDLPIFFIITGVSAVLVVEVVDFVVAALGAGLFGFGVGVSALVAGLALVVAAAALAAFLSATLALRQRSF